MKSRAATLLGYFIFVAVAVYLILNNLHITSDMSLFLPDGASTKQKILIQQLQNGSDSRLILVGIEGEPSEEVAEANRELANVLLDSPYFSVVHNGEQGLDSPEMKALFSNRYVLSPQISDQSFSREGLEKVLHAQFNEMATSTSVVSKRLLPQDPTGEFLEVIKQWGGVDRITKLHGIFFSAEHDRSLLLLKTKQSGTDLEAQSKVIDFIQYTFNQLPYNNLKLILSGPTVIAINTRNEIRSDTKQLSIAASLIATVFLFIAFSSLYVVILCAIPIITGVIAGMAGLALYTDSVHGITIAFGSTLIGIAVDYPMHFFSQLNRFGTSVREQFKKIWTTLRLGMITTIIGFSALIFSDYQGLIQIGLFSIIGLVTASLTAYWVLPAMLPTNFTLRTTLVSLQRLLSTIVRRLPKLRPALFVIVLACGFILIYQGDKIWQDDLAKLSPLSAEIKAIDNRLRKDLGAEFSGQSLIVIASSKQQALQRSEALSRQLDVLVSDQVIDNYASATHFLPSLETQKQRQLLLPEAQELKNNLYSVLRYIPFRRAIFDPFISDITKAKLAAPLSEAAYADSLIGDRLQNMLFEFDGHWIVRHPLYGINDNKLIQSLTSESDGTEVLYVDTKLETGRLLATYRDRAIQLFLWGSLAILFVLSIGLRSIVDGVIVVAAPLSVVVVNCVLLLYFGPGGLTLFHLISLLLVVGLGIDYALFFSRLGKYPDEWLTTFPALLKSWLTTVLVFGSLTLSNTAVLQTIGLTVASGVTLCFIFGASFQRSTLVPHRF